MSAGPEDPSRYDGLHLTVEVVREWTGTLSVGKKGGLWLRPDDGSSSVNVTAQEVARALRAAGPKSGDLVIVRSTEERGEVTQVDDDRAYVMTATGGGWLELTDLQVVPDEA